MRLALPTLVSNLLLVVRIDRPTLLLTKAFPVNQRRVTVDIVLPRFNIFSGELSLHCRNGRQITKPVAFNLYEMNGYKFLWNVSLLRPWVCRSRPHLSSPRL